MFLFFGFILWLMFTFQATLENVSTLKAALEDVMPEGYANLTNAFTKAFKVLEKVRQTKCLITEQSYATRTL